MSSTSYNASSLGGLIVAVAVGVLILPIISLMAAPSLAAPLARLVFVPSTEQSLAAQQVKEALTSHTWRRVGNQKHHLAPEVTTWEFYPKGTFRWRFTSDYTESYAGAWALSAASEERGIVFLASTAHDRGRSARFHVLSFEFRNGRLRLGEAFYQGIPFPNRDGGPPHIRTEDHEAVTPSQQSRFFSLWTALTVSNWRSEAVPPPGDPVTYSFMRDGTYTAHFAATQCHYSGTWSLFSPGENTGEIRFSTPANRCDPRGPREAFVRAMPITLRDTRLFLYQTVYVPSQRRR